MLLGFLSFKGFPMKNILCSLCWCLFIHCTRLIVIYLTVCKIKEYMQMPKLNKMFLLTPNLSLKKINCFSNKAGNLLMCFSHNVIIPTLSKLLSWKVKFKVFSCYATLHGGHVEMQHSPLLLPVGSISSLSSTRITLQSHTIYGRSSLYLWKLSLYKTCNIHWCLMSRSLTSLIY